MNERSTRPLVIIPTYNEAENITSLIPAVLDSLEGSEVLVVDDGSPDGTAALVEDLARADNRVNLLKRDRKGGLGPSYLAGFTWGLSRAYSHFFEMDADFSHDASDLPRLLQASKTAQLAIGSRYVPGGRVEGWSRFRHLLSRLGNIYVRMLLRLPVRDATSGFRCFRREILERVNLTGVSSGGYAFQIEMADRVHRIGGEIVEVPIVFVERRHGRSKMSFSIILEGIYKPLVWAFRPSRRRH